MIVEVRGAGFSNKGAELMLRTAAKRLRERDPAVQIAIEPTEGARFAERSQLGLAAIYPSSNLLSGRLRSAALRSRWIRSLAFLPMRASLPQQADSMLGLIDRKQSDALIDIAGYAYGDKFPPVKTRVAAEAAADYARRSKPVIFMPQMFGPFKNANGRSWFSRAADRSDLLYARDQVSYDMVREVIGDDPRLRLCPDMTIASLPPEGTITLPKEGTAPYACIVPNERMAEQGRAEWGDKYLSRLHDALERISQAGLRPVIVIHTSDPGDRQMAEHLKAQLAGADAEIFDNPDPYALKLKLGGARFLVGSRFHSIVAALSMGVPAVSLGWAHKYEMLARDFGVERLMHRGADAPEHLISLVDELIDPSANEALRETIRVRGDACRSKVEEMWAAVHQLLEATR